MRSFLSGAFTSAAAVMLTAFSLQAEAAQIFNRVATFHVADNLPQDVDPKQSTAAEIVTATEDGMMLVYTDSPGKRVGFIDIVDFKAPKGAGTLAMEGEPTSAVVVGGRALVGVVTSSAKDKPSGVLAVVDLARKSVEAICDLGGQPDSLAVSPDHRHLAIAIENERDEEVNDGALPQLPGGNLTTFMVEADGKVDCATRKVIDLTGIAAIAAEDPEPESLTSMVPTRLWSRCRRTTTWS